MEEIRLKHPFEAEGKKVETVKITRKKITVLDRIKAAQEAQATFGTRDGDAFIICILNRLCDFGVKIPSLELAEKLSAEDFDEIVMKLLDISEDFFSQFQKETEVS